MRKVFRSDFLFTTPTIWTGFGSVLDLFGSREQYNYSKSTLEADVKALRNDWGVVGQDIQAAQEELNTLL